MHARGITAKVASKDVCAVKISIDEYKNGCFVCLLYKLARINKPKIPTE
jgi:hypothetical protein